MTFAFVSIAFFTYIKNAYYLLDVSKVPTNFLLVRKLIIMLVCSRLKMLVCLRLSYFGEIENCCNQ